MAAMEFVAPSSIADAVSILKASNGNARVLAGGTDLLVQLRSGHTHPQQIVDIKHIPETRTIREDADGIWVGAAVCNAEIGEHAVLRAHWPGVVEGLELIGSAQIQGRSTPGGNLCNASPAADGVPGLIAARADCLIAGPGGERRAPVETIVLAPGRTSLEPGEFLVGFHLPKRTAKSGDAYLRFIPRTEMDIAVVGAAVNLTVDGSGAVTAARVALGAVAPTPLLVAPAAAAIIGSPLDDAALERLASAASAACNPIDDKRGTVAYRTKVAGVLAARAARIAAARAEQY